MELPRRAAVLAFLAFAFAYFFSALLRGVVATLAPVLTSEFDLRAGDLGLLAGGYFLGFSLVQLPLGRWLDRHGPRKVLLGFMVVGVAACAAFALAQGFASLLVARMLCGAGVGACLMAPLTGYRRWLAPALQLRANAWMLMTGSLGLLASTLPVQWLLPLVGWRALFWGIAACLALAMALVAWRVPGWQATPPKPGEDTGYREVWRHSYFRRLAPLGFFTYGGMVAMQTLWAGPWMVRVAGYTPQQAAGGLFAINLAMLFTFWAWGWATPRLAARGWTTSRLIAWGVPLSLLTLAGLVLGGEQAGAVAWVLFCVATSCVSLAQPSVGMAFPPAQAGRALSAFNLVIFAGVFAVQWGLGLLVDAFQALGAGEVAAFRAALAVYGATSVASWAYFMRNTSDPLPAAPSQAG